MLILLKLAFLINCLYARLCVLHLILYAPNTLKLKKNFLISGGEMFLIVLMSNATYNCCNFQTTLILICLCSEFDSH